MINEQVKPLGDLFIEVFREDGSKEEYAVHNLVVNLGKAWIASRMKDATSAVASHMAIGTGTAAAMGTDTALGTEVGRSALTSTTQVTTTVTNDSLQYVATFGPGVGTGAITEAALLNAASGGTMICRTVFSVLNKGANDTVTITWKIRVS